MTDVIKFGDIGDKFYLMFKGIVAVHIPNPGIKDWTSMRRDYLKLLRWKKEIFDVKVS
jgi:hypothetical protein